LEKCEKHVETKRSSVSWRDNNVWKVDMYFKEIKAKLTFISKKSDDAIPRMLMLSASGFSLLDRCQPEVSGVLLPA
jgi:hypothetical protein